MVRAAGSMSLLHPMNLLGAGGGDMMFEDDESEDCEVVLGSLGVKDRHREGQESHLFDREDLGLHLDLRPIADELHNSIEPKRIDMAVS